LTAAHGLQDGFTNQDVIRVEDPYWKHHKLGGYLVDHPVDVRDDGLTVLISVLAVQVVEVDGGRLEEGQRFSVFRAADGDGVF
jgi:hypothetical protein